MAVRSPGRPRIAPFARILADPSRRREGRQPPFYGWVMLIVTMLATMATSPGQSFVVGAFSEAIRAELGLSLAGFSAAYMIATFAASLPLTLVGKLSDRFGTRIVAALVALALGGACGFIGLATWAATRFGLEAGPTRAAVFVTLTVAFFLLRFLGQGALGLVSSHALAMWFDRRLGFVESIRHLGMPLAVAVLPAVLVPLIETVGWRQAYLLLGLGVWCLVLPLVWGAHVNRPEDIGQNIDGGTVRRPAPSSERIDVELDAPAIGEAGAGHGIGRRQGPERTADRSFTLREAMRTRAYWVVTASMVLSAAVGTAFVFHVQPMMKDIDVGPEGAIAVMATLAGR